MNVILLEKIGKLGEIGDTANVKSGYARNFLFPQGKAIPATKINLEEFDQRKSELMAAHNEKIGVAQARAEKVNGTSLTIEVNSSDEGKLFGSVGTRDVADAVNAKAGSDITKAEVSMPHGVIRELGDYQISLELGYDVKATISVSVVGLESTAGVSADGSLIEEIDEAEAANASESDDSEESSDSSKEEKLAE
jgi:large subunit ribosomal protein L9|tara:strand:- start:4517 stop:5098 length:582 start_codon:yes stop_codon:yes gene_type:complete